MAAYDEITNKQLAVWLIASTSPTARAFRQEHNITETRSPRSIVIEGVMHLVESFEPPVRKQHVQAFLSSRNPTYRPMTGFATPQTAHASLPRRPRLSDTKPTAVGKLTVPRSERLPMQLTETHRQFLADPQRRRKLARGILMDGGITVAGIRAKRHVPYEPQPNDGLVETLADALEQCFTEDDLARLINLVGHYYA